MTAIDDSDEINGNGKDATHNTMQLLNAIGGIDKICNDYLCKRRVDELRLNRKQLNKVCNILQPKERKNAFRRHKTITYLAANVNTNTDRQYNDDEFYYEFHEHDTMLYVYFSKQTAKLVSSIGSSTCVRLLLVFTILTYNILSNISLGGIGTFIHPLYSIPFSCLIWIPYSIYTLLCVHTIACKLLAKSFEFWFKILMVIIHFIAICVDFFIFNSTKWDYPKLACAERVLYGISITLAITVIALFDGLAVSRKWKIIITLGIAFGTTFWSIKNMILTANEVGEINDSVIYMIPHMPISLRSIQVSSMRLLAIFVWRQTILTYIRKDQAVLLQKTPFVIWNVDSNENENKEESDDSDSDNDQNLNTMNSPRVNHHILDLVDMLGGIDEIAANYLNHEKKTAIQPILNQEQLDTIRAFIKDRESDDDLQRTETNMNTTAHKIYFFFDANNTFLNYLFAQKKAQILLSLLQSNIIKSILYIGILIYITHVILLIECKFIMNLNHIELFILSVQYINVFVAYFIFIPYAIISFLSLNKQAFTFILKTPDFWLLSIYGTIYILSTLMDELFSHSYNTFVLLDNISFSVWCCFLILCTVSMDAINISQNMKIYKLSFISIIAILWTIYLMFIRLANAEIRYNSIVHITANYGVSLLSLRVSGCRVVTIFICKQLLWYLKNNIQKRKNKVALIKYVPYIQWYFNPQINDKKKENEIQEIVIQIEMENTVRKEKSLSMAGVVSENIISMAS